MNEIFKLFGTIGVNNSDANKKIDETTDKAKKSSDTMSKSFREGATKIGKGMQSVGNTLTKWITKPAIIAATAVGGIVTAFGWGRLKSIEEAEAKLRGMGYTTEDVKRISKNALAAIETGMMDIAQATDVAAGALAAGVSEGAELERYIRLVDAAAVGANRPVSEMAMIFNRVQGSGKLMTQELNSIEQSMPGFSAAMADNLGVSQEAFREMVTNGEVDTARFLDVMETFAGGMAEEYATTWSGMISYTKSYIGKIGEQFLGGVFGQSKDALAEFNEFLISDEVMEWAAAVGVKLADAFSNLVSKVKDLITWWTGLDSGTQKLIGKFALFLIAIGPILSKIGGLLIALPKLINGFSLLKTGITKLPGLFSKFGTTLKGLASPLTLKIALIAALVAAGIWLYQNWDTVKEKATEIWGAIKDWFVEVLTSIKEWFIETWESITEGFNNAVEWIGEGIDNIVQWFKDLPGRIGEFISNIIESIIQWAQDMREKAIETGKNFVDGVIEFFSDLPYKIGYVIGLVIGHVAKFVIDMTKKAIELGKEFVNNVIDWFKKLPGRVKDWITKTANNIKEWAIDITTRAKEAAKEFLDNIINWFKNLPGRVKDWLDRTITNIRNWASDIIARASNAARDFLNRIIDWFSKLPGRIKTWLDQTIQRVRAWASDLIKRGLDAATELVNAVVNGVKALPGKMKQAGKDLVRGFWNGITSLGSWLGKQVKGFFTGIVDGVKNVFNMHSPSRLFFQFGQWIDEGLINGIVSKGKQVANTMKGMAEKAIDGVEGLMTKVPDIGGAVQHNIVPDTRNISLSSSGVAQVENQRIDFRGFINALIEEIRNIAKDDSPIIIQLDKKTIAKVTRDPLDKELGKKDRDKQQSKGRR